MSRTLIENFIETLVSEALDEKLRGGFNLAHFKTLGDWDYKKTYAEQNLARLGRGSSRIVFALSSGKVLKLAFGNMYEAGCAQNEAEVELSTNPQVRPVIARVFDADTEEYSWIISEITRPFSGGGFEQTIGAELETFEEILRVCLMKNVGVERAIELLRWKAENYVRTSAPDMKKYAKKDLMHLEERLKNINITKLVPLVKGVLAMKKQLGLNIDDLIRSEHYGLTADGRIVVIDYGFTEQIGIDHYGYEPADYGSNEPVGSLTEAFDNLVEGGLGGHMQHLYDNKDLTFGDLKQIFQLATQGKLEQVSEKLDGQNFFFTYDLSSGQVKFARNKGNIKTGGMTEKDIASKWADVPKVAQAFGMAYKIMSSAMGTLPPETLQSIFGPNGNVWFSAEVITTANPNVINYDRNILVFHRSGIAYDQNGNPVSDFDGEANFERLVGTIEQLQQSVANSGWKIAGPVVVPLRKLSTKEPLQKATADLTEIQSKYGLSDDNTLRDYLKVGLLQGPLKGLNATTPAKEGLAELMVSEELGIKNKKIQLQKYFPTKEQFVEAAKYINEAPKFMSSLIAPIESIIHEFAVSILEGVHSLVALNPQQEVKRLQGEVKAAIDRIKASGNQDFIGRLDKELERLKSIDRITSSMEGIVFKFKDNVYKFSGLFAPINQLLGLVRYGRGGVVV